MSSSILKIFTALSMALFLLFSAPGKAEAASDCGGLNQKSCWSVNPKDWCKGDLQYKPGGLPGKGTCVRPKPTPPKEQAKKDCGGENQKSCWNVDPTKWCEPGLKYTGTGVPGQGKCIVPPLDDTPDCGGLGQASCWSANPKKWCDGDLKYVPGGLPGKGTCVRRASNGEIQEAARKTFDRIESLGKNNPLMNLRTCLLRPANYEELKKQMSRRSGNGINALLARCGTNPTSLKSYGQQVTGKSSSTLSIELGAGAVAGVGAEGAMGYAIPLEKNPDGRFYLTGGVGGGVGAAVGADVSLGLSNETMPTEHWATDNGKSVNFSGKALGAVSFSIDFPGEGAVPSGFTVSGGVGVGAEIGVVIFTKDQYLYNL